MEEMKKELNGSTINSERHENKKLEERANKVKKKTEDAAAVSENSRKSSKTRKKNRLVSIPTRNSLQ